ncbi:MAG TPA: ferredoxin [Jatrophihabitantaceae bacterium]|jgi:ferredoxin
MVRIHVDTAVCEGHGECVAAAPEFFDLGDDDGAVHVVGQPSDEQSETKARGAVLVCPVGAISLLSREPAQP